MDDKEFELNFESLELFKPRARSEREMIRALCETVRAIAYLLKVMKIEVNNELYQRLDSDGKEFFKTVRDK